MFYFYSQLLREQIARQRVGTTDEGMNTRHFPAHEREDLVRQLETSREEVCYYTPNYVCGRVYCFHVVRPSERTNESVSETFCFLNILKSP